MGVERCGMHEYVVVVVVCAVCACALCVSCGMVVAVAHTLRQSGFIVPITNVCIVRKCCPFVMVGHSIRNILFICLTNSKLSGNPTKK
jgi:ABC-type transport system involved in cytochrome c biogenesis permease component